MKQTKRFLLFILLVLVGNSCSKKNEDPQPSNSTTSKITSNANSGFVYYEGNGITNQTAVKASFASSKLTIAGTNFNLTIDTIVGIVGTYDITSTNFVRYISLQNNSISYSSYGSTGKIVITSVDRANQSISGYFSVNMLDASNTYPFNGDFKDIKYVRPSKMTALIDGSNWSYSSPTYSVSSGQLNISASNILGTSIYINLKNVTGTGTYTLAQTGNYTMSLFTWISSSVVSFEAVSGTVVITVYDTTNKIIKGTFSANMNELYGGTRTRTVTNGTFDIQMP